MPEELPLVATPEECARILTEIIRVTPADFVDDKGEPLPAASITAPLAIQELSVRRTKNGDVTTKVKPYDKLRAMQELATQLAWSAEPASGEPVVVNITPAPAEPS